MELKRLLGILALAVLLVSSAFVLPLALPASAAGPNPANPAATRTFTLHGDTTDGWGNTNTSIREPGPTLAVLAGDTVTIHLYSNDSVLHNWFIDFDGNNAPSAGEPSSADFSSPSVASDFVFTVPSGHVGTFTYKCRLHPTSMTGSIMIQAAPTPATFTLYGDAADGWGLTSGSIASPGPTLNVSQDQTVTIDLYAADGADHTFYIDWNRNGQFDPASETRVSFNSSTIPVRYPFTASGAGNFTYYCTIHPGLMRGTVHVASSGTAPPASPDYVIYAAVIIIVVIVAIAVGLLMKRRPRAPPQPPPAQP